MKTKKGLLFLLGLLCLAFSSKADNITVNFNINGVDWPSGGVTVTNGWTFKINLSNFESNFIYKWSTIEWEVLDNLNNDAQVSTATSTYSPETPTTQLDPPRTITINKTGWYKIRVTCTLRRINATTSADAGTTTATQTSTAFIVFPGPTFSSYNAEPFQRNDQLEFVAYGTVMGREPYTFTWSFPGADAALSTGLNGSLQATQSFDNTSGTATITKLNAKVVYTTAGSKTITLTVSANPSTNAAKSFSRNYTIHVGPDLYMADNAGDGGSEPLSGYNVSDIVHSPDLWVRRSVYTTNPNSNPGAFNGDNQHQAPSYDATNELYNNRVYYKVRNRGDVTSNGNDQLQLYWTIARTTEIWSGHWLYNLSGNSQTKYGVQQPLGSEITLNNWTTSPFYSTSSHPVTIPSISPGGAYINYVDWRAPNPDMYSPTGIQWNANKQIPVICLLARVLEPAKTSYGMYNEQNNVDVVTENVPRNNNIVTRNTLLFYAGRDVYHPGGDNRQLGFMRLNNATAVTRDVTIGFRLTQGTTQITSYADIFIAVSDNVYQTIVSNNSQVTGLEFVSAGLYRVTNLNTAAISNIPLAAGADEFVGVIMDYIPDNNMPDNLEREDHFVFGEMQGNAFISSPSEFVSIIDNVQSGTASEPATLGSQELKNKQAAVYTQVDHENNRVIISGMDADQVKYTLYDITGRAIRTDRVGQDGKIVLADLHSGVYIIHISGANGENLIVEKIVKP